MAEPVPSDAKALSGLYHETQIGALCGQHVLNNLLQGPYVTLDSLSEIARMLDKNEHEVLYNRPSEPYNLEADGFCNIQVLQTILKNRENIELIPFNSKNKIADDARARPHHVRAYLCNFAEHWFAIRKFGQFYFDLNSMYAVPQLLLDEDLLEELQFIQTSGGSIFIVDGNFPDCEAEHRINSPTFDPSKYLSISESLPMPSTEQDSLVVLEKPGPDGKYILRVPQRILDQYGTNPDSPIFQQVVSRCLPPEAKGRVILAARTAEQEAAIANSRKGTKTKTMEIVETLLIIRRQSGVSMDQLSKCECPSCQVEKSATEVDDAMTDYQLALEQINQHKREAVERQRELDSQIEKNLQKMEHFSTHIKLHETIITATQKLFDDIRKFEELRDHVRNIRTPTPRCEASVSNSLKQMNDGFKQVAAAGKLLREDMEALGKAREALYQYQYDKAIEESLSSANSVPAIESTENVSQLAIMPPTPPEDPAPLVNTFAFELTVPDSSLPTDDDLPAPIAGDMTVEELRALRQKKFGNRNVSLISRVYSPMDP